MVDVRTGSKTASPDSLVLIDIFHSLPLSHIQSIILLYYNMLHNVNKNVRNRLLLVGLNTVHFTDTETGIDFWGSSLLKGLV